jgi:hypothetical protein
MKDKKTYQGDGPFGTRGAFHSADHSRWFQDVKLKNSGNISVFTPEHQAHLTNLEVNRWYSA